VVVTTPCSRPHRVSSRVSHNCVQPSPTPTRFIRTNYAQTKLFARLFPVPFRHDFVGNRGESARHEHVSVAGRAAATRGMRIPPTHAPRSGAYKIASVTTNAILYVIFVVYLSARYCGNSGTGNLENNV
jgi:hypothetical protein